MNQAITIERHCSKCGSYKTRPNNKGSWNWYRDGSGGYLCEECYRHSKRYKEQIRPQWKARFLVLRAKHEGIMKQELERIIKELEIIKNAHSYHLEKDDLLIEERDFRRACVIVYDRVIKIIKNE